MAASFPPEAPTFRPIKQLLSRTDHDAVPELAAALCDLLDAPFLRAAVDARFLVRAIDLGGATPTFPGAIVVADGLDPHVPAVRAPTLELDREELLATPVLHSEGRNQTVLEVLIAAKTRSEVPGARPSPAASACVRTIARVVIDTLQSLDPPVDDLRAVLAHHTVPSGASLFVARDAALNTLGIDARLDGGLSLAAAVKLVRPRSSQSRVAYEVGDVHGDALLFSIRTTIDESVHVLCRMGSGPVLEIGARIAGLFDRYVKLMVAVRFSPYSQLRVWVDDTLVGSARGDAASTSRLVGRQTIGAGILGKHRSALFLRELILVGRALDPAARARVSRRLDRHC
jgi:hypothetical protein